MRALGLKWTLFFAALFCALAAWPSDTDIQNIVAQVSQQQYTTFQLAVQNMGLGTYGGTYYNQTTRGRNFTAILGDKGNQETRKYLVETFNGFGIQSAVQGKVFNVVAEMPGATTPQNVYIIAAHYDTLRSNLPGGDSDACGVAGLLEAARVLSQYKFDSTIRFVVFNATDHTDRGSADYVRNVVGIRNETLLGVLILDEILHPYHDKNPALPEALAIGVAAKTGVAPTYAAAFTACAQQFVPALAIDPAGPVIDLAGDELSFVSYEFLSSLKLTENSSKDQANREIGTPADASDAAAGAHYDYGFATNVVSAAVAFMAQQAGYEGLSDGSSPYYLDSDGDGYNDEIEAALGSDPTLSSSTPSNLPPAIPSGFLEVTSYVVSLDYSVSGQDIVTVVGLMPVHAGFVALGTPVIIDAGGVVKMVKLKKTGNGKVGDNTFTVKLKTAKGVVTEQMAQFTFTFGLGNFKTDFQRFGLVNAGFLGKPVTIPLTVIFGNEVRNTTKILIYSATKNMIGIAR